MITASTACRKDTTTSWSWTGIGHLRECLAKRQRRSANRHVRRQDGARRYGSVIIRMALAVACVTSPDRHRPPQSP